MRAGAFHLGVDRPGDDIARRQRAFRVRLRHEILALAIAQNSALAAHGFGNQEGGRLRMKEAGGMKLDELHVGDDRAGTPRHRHAVAGRDGGVGRVEIHFAASAGREDQAIGSNRFHRPGYFIEHVNPEAMVLGRKAKFRGCDQIDRHVILEQLECSANPATARSSVASIS